jgi:H+/Cl- antiporter ClcA
MPPERPPEHSHGAIPPTLKHRSAKPFWIAALLTAGATGLGAAALTKLLEIVQGLAWGGSGTQLLQAVERVSPLRHVMVLFGAAVVTGLGQILLKHLSSANGIDTTAAIWFNGGRMPAIRTLGSAILSAIIVAMGVSLGREGAPKQAGAVFANFFSDRASLSDEQRRLLVACAAGAGMAAAYGVPLGGALFSLEVLRGKLALRFVLPAIVVSVIATWVSWIFLPDAPTYVIPSYSSSGSALVWALLAGPIAGLASVGYVRMISGRPAAAHRLASTDRTSWSIRGARYRFDLAPSDPW